LQPFLDMGRRARNLARDEGFSAPGRLMVEQNAIAGVETVTLAVIDRSPIGEDLGAGIRTARIEGSSFGLRSFQDFTEHLAARSLVKARTDLGFLDRLEDSDGA